MPHVVIIAGATASGKSAFALQRAATQPSVIINADAMQLYADAPLLTAQPSPAERDAIPHLLYGVLHTEDVCNVARWCNMAVDAIKEAWQAGNLPIVIGGTGLYLNALRHGLSTVPAIDPALRAYIRAMPTAELYAALSEEDPDMAARLKPQDTQRLSRALEVIRSTQHSLLWWQQQPCTPPLPEAIFDMQLVELPRPVLYERINQRYEKIVQAGGLEEAAHLLAQGYAPDLPLMRAVGVRQLFPYLRGECSLLDAIIAGQTATRQYAKRQLTWIRHQFL